MAAPRVEKAYEKHAWIILFLIGMVFVPAIFFNLVSGNYVDSLITLGFVVLTVLVSATSYRKGKKWAWYLLWYVPVFVAASFLASAPEQNLRSAIIFVLLAVLGLLLPYRKFFPKAQVAPM